MSLVRCTTISPVQQMGIQSESCLAAGHSWSHFWSTTMSSFVVQVEKTRMAMALFRQWRWHYFMMQHLGLCSVSLHQKYLWFKALDGSSLVTFRQVLDVDSFVSKAACRALKYCKGQMVQEKAIGVLVDGNSSLRSGAGTSLLGRLFTKEDGFNIHKTFLGCFPDVSLRRAFSPPNCFCICRRLGISVLVHVLYRAYAQLARIPDCLRCRACR